MEYFITVRLSSTKTKTQTPMQWGHNLWKCWSGGGGTLCPASYGALLYQKTMHTRCLGGFLISVYQQFLALKMLCCRPRCPLYLLSCMSFKSHCSRRPRCSSLSSLRSQVPLRLARENSEWIKPATCNLQRDPQHCKPKARTEPAVSLGYSTSCCFGLGWGCVGWEYCNYSDVAGD